MAHVLLVDDDHAAVARNRATLEAAGHTVTTATNSIQALEALRHGPCDAVVLEALLDGGMAGFDLARTLARRYPSLPRLMLTRADERLSRKQRADQDRDGWLPVHRYMQKPVLPAVLVSEVEHLVQAAA